MRGWVRLVALAIVVVAALPAAAVAQVRGGTIRVGMDADTTTMDPHRSTAAVDRQVYNNVYSKLVDIDARFGIVPQLAQTWEIKGRRPRVRLQAAPRREIPRRHRVQRRHREVEFRSHARPRAGLAAAKRDRSGQGRQGPRSLHGRDDAFQPVRSSVVGIDRSRRE